MEKPTQRTPRGRPSSAPGLRLFGIRGRLLILVLAAMTPLVILGVLHIRQELRAARALQLERATGQARVIASLVDSQLRSIDTFLAGLTAVISAKPEELQKNQMLLLAVQGNLPPFYQRVSAFTRDGQSLGSTDSSVPGENETRLLIRPATRERLSIEATPVRLPTGNHTLAFGRALLDAEQRAVGMVVVRVVLEWPGALFEVNGIPSGTTVAVVNEHRVILGRSGEAQTWIGRDAIEPGALGDVKGAAEEASAESQKMGSDVVGVAMSTLAPWKIYVGVPAVSSYASLRQEFGRTLLIAAGAIAAALILAWLIAGRITRPLLQLAADARTFSTGETRHRSRVRSRSEVGSLARTFNRMLDSLDRRDFALRSSESRYRALIDHATEAIVVLDVEKAVFVDHNPEAERLFKLDREGMRATHLAALSPELQPDGRHSVEAMQSYLQQAVDGSLPVFEWLHRDSGGAEILCEVRLLRLPSERGVLVRGSVTAISERKRNERRLAQTMTLQRAILDNAGYAIISTTPEGMITTFNSAAERLLGYNAAMVMGTHVSRLIHHSDEIEARTQALSDELGRMIAPGFEVFLDQVQADARGEQEWTYIREDGARVPVQVAVTALSDQAGNITGFIGMAVDITDRHRAEQQLAHERTVLELIARGTPQNVVLTMLLKGHEALFPGACGAVMLLDGGGRRFTQMVAPSLAEDFSSRLIAAEIGPLQGSQTDGFPAFTGKTTVVTNISADPRWDALREPAHDHGLRSCWSTPIRSGPGAMLGTLAVYYRESREPAAHELAALAGSARLAGLAIERRQAEVARGEFERKLLETQKLESLGVLAGGIAHDFNNLLTGILGNSDLARAELPKSSPIQAYLEQINHSSLRAADLCKQMLAYSGRGRFLVQKLDLNLLVTETIHLLQISISKKAELRFDLAPHLSSIEADSTQIRQVVMNLVINASEALGDQGGIISIRTDAITVDDAYLSGMSTAPEKSRGRYVRLEITDDGCGMSHETQQKIFDPFFSTKFTGRGLGLAAVLGIIRGHEGALRVKSQLGKGTTFELLFPQLLGPAEKTSAPPPPTTEWQGEGAVLIADDEEPIRKVGASMLNAMGFETVLAADGREAVTAFRADPKKFSFVLLDLTMPQMDGEQAFTEMRLIKPDVRVILMSGFNRQESVARFTGRGLANFLQKPFDLNGLRDAVRTVVDSDEA